MDISFSYLSFFSIVFIPPPNFSFLLSTFILWKSFLRFFQMCYFYPYLKKENFGIFGESEVGGGYPHCISSSEKQYPSALPISIFTLYSKFIQKFYSGFSMSRGWEIPQCTKEKKYVYTEHTVQIRIPTNEQKSPHNTINPGWGKARCLSTIEWRSKLPGDQTFSKHHPEVNKIPHI